MRLQGKKAIVTGGAQGIGCAIALEFAKEGADVAIVDLQENIAKQVTEKIRGMGQQALAVKANVAHGDEISQMVEQVVKTFGRIDILVNSAGIGGKASSTAEVLEAAWKETMDVNFNGTFICCQTVGRRMIKQGGGTIVNIDSISSEHPEMGYHVYSPSKAAVVSLTKLLAVEWGCYGIRVNTLSPGPTRSRMEESNYPTEADAVARAKTLPLGRLVEIIDQAKAAVFLASDEAKSITGIVLPVDCGASCSMFYLVPQRGL